MGKEGNAMIGLGTIINTGAILAGGLLGAVFGKYRKKNTQEGLTKACGVSTLFVAVAGVMEGMMTVQGTGLVSGGALLIIGCLAVGTLIGELLKIEDAFERFGQWLKIKTGNAKDKGFVNAFVTASLTVCIGAMAIVGSIQDGIQGDWSILATKAVLDLIIIMVMTSSMGKGCAFSAIPIFAFEGSITLLSRLIAPFMTETAIENLSLIGSILIFCVGINLVWGKKVRVANMLPAVLLAILAAYLPPL